MPKRQLLDFVSTYLLRFEEIRNARRDDRLAPKAIAVLNEFRKELEGKNTNLNNIVYPNLGFHYWRSNFDSISISNNELASYLIMEQFIDKMQTTPSKTNMTMLLVRYKNEALFPAFEVYKASKLTLDFATRRTLRAIFDGLTVCIEGPYGLTSTSIRSMKAVTNAFSSAKKATTTLFKEGVSEAASELYDTGKSLFKENKDLVAIHSFMLKFEELLFEGKIRTSDLIALKDGAKNAKEYILQHPEIKEVKRFHWLINMVCDFINKYIYEVFESQHTKDINRLFSQLDQEQKKAEHMERDVENNWRSFALT
jgi:hypothetical protein